MKSSDTFGETSVHESLAQSVMASQTPSKPLKTFSFRMTESEGALASSVCKANGTTLSSYLRECCRSLIKDYGANPDAE